MNAHPSLPPELTSILSQLNALRVQLTNLDRIWRKEPPCFSRD